MAPPQILLPPRIKWDPPLSSAKMIVQKQTNIWMASVTKIVFLLKDAKSLRCLMVDRNESLHLL